MKATLTTIKWFAAAVLTVSIPLSGFVVSSMTGHLKSIRDDVKAMSATMSASALTTTELKMEVKQIQRDLVSIQGGR